MRLPRLLAGFVGNCGVALAAGTRAAEQLDSLELRRPSPQLSRNFSLPSSFASVVSARFSFAFVPRYLSILTLLPSHFFRAITCSVFPLHALQIETEEKKRRRRVISNASFTNVNFSILSRIINKTW